MEKIKVLWMNNGDESYKAFVTNSNLKNLAITFCDNVKESEQRIKEDNWDAIILDAEPKRMRNEIPHVNNLFDEYIKLKSENRLIPIFVATANTSIDDWNKRIAKDHFYELPTSSEQLYEDIKAEVESNTDYRLRKNYEKIFEFYSSLEDSKSDELLLRLLKSFHEDNFYKNSLVPANVRLILDKVMIFLTNVGILQNTKFNGSNLRECSIELGKKGKIVPYHVQRCFHSCVDIANNGNHQIPEETENSYKIRMSNPLFVNKQITNLQAPYLNKGLVYDLLNILHWCATINDEKNEK